MKVSSHTDNHDHQQCIEQALKKASELCSLRGLRLTELRTQILQIIWQTHQPIGAYAIMDKLAVASYRERVAPPTVYRSLEFLVKHALVHRVHSLNAYIGRKNPSSQSCEALLLCSDCGHAEEVPNRAIEQAINLCANEHRFNVQEQVLEILGLCRHCKPTNERARG
ncbi:MAG: Fur family zinc uptake transcriptional regulator [Flavobacteriales bacterium]|jgi:Fur family zinc uptake transcriptional regulator